VAEGRSLATDFAGKVRKDQRRRGGAGVKNGSGRTPKDPFLRPDPTGGSASHLTPNSPKRSPDARLFAGSMPVEGRRHDARDEHDDGKRGAECGRKRHGVRSDPDAVRAGGWRGAAGGLARLLQGSPLFYFPTKEANHHLRATGQDFTQLSVIRSTNARREESTDWNGARVEGTPLGKDPPDQARRRITDVV